MAGVVALGITIDPRPRHARAPRDVEITYASAAPDRTSPTQTATRTVRLRLDELHRGAASLDDVAPGSLITVRVLSESGVTLTTKQIAAPRDGGQASVALDGKALRAAPPAPPVETGRVLRAARLVAIGTPVPFGSCRLLVTALDSSAAAWRDSGLAQLFAAQDPTAGSVAYTELPAETRALPWVAVRLAVDGAFAASLPADARAWAWMVSGAVQAIGVVRERPAEAMTSLAIALPPVLGIAADLMADSTMPLGDGAASEAELARNPDVYAEDPGSACAPYSNPERVLGEKNFFVVLRAEQPAIGGAPRLATATPRLATRPVEPDALVDDKAAYGASDGVRVEMDAAHPLPWEGDASRSQAMTVARGHILEMRLRWRSNGYSLGNVIKTLTLAPRQVKRIQTIEWRRAERARRSEVSQQADRVADVVDRERTYEDEVEAHLDEWSYGSSRSAMAGVGLGVGFAKGGFVVGGGAVASAAASDSQQVGGRAVAASEEQRLRDTIRRFADALRRFESTVVTEVEQEETVTGTVEVVRNANYAHSLSVVYHQILRHLRVDTEYAGVRECLFVPLAIKPFTIDRAHRWRESIGRALRSPGYANALGRLRDVATDFAHSDIPPGRRSDQPVRQITGSIFVNLAVALPADGPEGAFDAAGWASLQPFMRGSSAAFHATLAAQTIAQRHDLFQRQAASVIATSWANRLRLAAGDIEFDADFTLATRYAYNRPVRIDFSAVLPDDVSVSREQLAALCVRATRALSKGSIANVVESSFTYSTDAFSRAVRARGSADDLLSIDTGQPDPNGALIGTTPSDWERRNLRDEIRRAVDDLLEHVNEHVEYYHKAIWWGMDRDRLLMLLDGFFVPRSAGVSVASVVERDPVAIVGNSLVYRVSSGVFLGIDNLDTAAKLDAYYRSSQAPRDPMLVSLPTDGLYARTLMDPCEALEEHFGSIDWVLDQADPDLGSLSPELLQSRVTPTTDTAPTPMPGTIINLQNAPEAPQPAGLAGILGAVTNAGAFRDMAGLAGTQANAAAAAQAAASLATNFGNQAAALELARLEQKKKAAKNANEKLASVQRAKDKGLIDDAQASDVAMSIMDDEFGSYQAPLPTPETIGKMLESSLGVPGSTTRAVTPFGTFESIVDIAAPMRAAAATVAKVLRAATGAYGEPDFFPTRVFIPDTKGDDYIDSAVTFHSAWGIPITRVKSFEDFIAQFVSNKPKGRIRLVTHARPDRLSINAFTGAPASFGVVEEFYAAAEAGDVPMIEQMAMLRLTGCDLSEPGTPTPAGPQSRRDQLVEHITNNALPVANAFATNVGIPGDDHVERFLQLRVNRTGMIDGRAKIAAQEASGVDLPTATHITQAHADAWVKAMDYLIKQLDLGKAVGRTPAQVNALAAAVDAALADPGMFAFAFLVVDDNFPADLSAAVDAVSKRSFRANYNKARTNLAGATLDIRGCNLGQKPSHMAEIKDFFDLASITAPDLFMGFPGTAFKSIPLDDANALVGRLLIEPRLVETMERYARVEFADEWDAATDDDARARVFFTRFFEPHRVLPVYHFEEALLGTPASEAFRLYHVTGDAAAAGNFLKSLWDKAPARTVVAIAKTWNITGAEKPPSFPALSDHLVIDPAATVADSVACPDPSYAEHIITA